jgi:mannitol-specific phosphotransferase system IIBC component
MNATTQTKTMTIGGTLTVLLANINSGDVIKTSVMAATGAVVSFVISQVLKMFLRWWKRGPQP